MLNVGYKLFILLSYASSMGVASFLSMSQSMRDDITRVKSYSIDDVHVQS